MGMDSEPSTGTGETGGPVLTQQLQCQLVCNMCVYPLRLRRPHPWFASLEAAYVT